MSIETRLSYVLTFEKIINTFIAELSETLFGNLSSHYLAGQGVIPHCTLIQALFNVENQELEQNLISELKRNFIGLDVIEVALKNDQVFSRHSMVDGEFVFLDLEKSEGLVELHHHFAKVIVDLGGENLTAKRRDSYLPHITLACLRETSPKLKLELPVGFPVRFPGQVRLGKNGTHGCVTSLY